MYEMYLFASAMFKDSAKTTHGGFFSDSHLKLLHISCRDVA